MKFKLNINLFKSDVGYLLTDNSDVKEGDYYISHVGKLEKCKNTYFYNSVTNEKINLLNTSLLSYPFHKVIAIQNIKYENIDFFKIPLDKKVLEIEIESENIVIGHNGMHNIFASKILYNIDGSIKIRKIKYEK